ncbi:MAG: M20/M25/M40 family metallo-hydrolase [Eubacteriales bacterium]|nr:M20/M25/M40 family metallo-hydrolase [Eubacteriales bacterium]
MNEIKGLLSNLTMEHGVSGFEYPLSEKVRDMFFEYCGDVTIDNMGNVIARLNPDSTGKTIMFEAHIDEIGLMVTKLCPNGKIKFQPIGGIDTAILPSSFVTIHGKKDITGVIGAKPPHLQSKDESDKRYKTDDLYIDTYMSYDQLKEVIRIGDSISFVSQPRSLLGNLYSSKSIDNRGGVATLLLCAKTLKEHGYSGNAVFLLSVQEEAGLRGATAASFDNKPDIAIVVDVTYGVSPTVSGSDGFPLGSGSAIATGPNIDPSIFEKLKEIANRNNLQYEIEVAPDSTGTDAWAMQVQAGGIPCGLVSLPLRYMHSHIETIDLDDIKTTVALLTEFAKEADL